MPRVIELLAEGLRKDGYRVDSSKNPITITIGGDGGGKKKKIPHTDTQNRSSSSDLFSKLVQEARQKEGRRTKKKKHRPFT
jgi:hypothetical protein